MTRTIVVVSADETRRADWVDAISSQGRCVVACGGPFAGCVLMDGRLSCPTLDRADLAVYDLEAVHSLFLARLFRAHPGLAIRFARDERPGLRHRPVLLTPDDPLGRREPVLA